MPLREAAGRTIRGLVFWRQGLNVAGRCYKTQDIGRCQHGLREPRSRRQGTPSRIIPSARGAQRTCCRASKPFHLCYGDLLAVQDGGEGRSGELRALIRIENRRLPAQCQRLLQRFDAERDIHRNRHPPGQHPPGEPIVNSEQIDKAASHGDVRDIRRPDPVRPVRCLLAQQLLIDLVSRCWFRRVRTAVDRLGRHSLHQRREMPSVDGHAIRLPANG